MFPGGPTTSAPGSAQEMILGLSVEIIAGSALHATMIPWGPYRFRYFAPFCNGIYSGQNIRPVLNDPLEFTAQIPVTANVGSIYFEDCGDWSSFDDYYIPSGEAERIEALTASQLQLAWANSFTVSAPFGDSQLSSFTIYGAKRGQNAAMLPHSLTRGRLSYSITSDGSTHIVRLWAADILVAEGSRSGNGSVTLSALNDSGLSATCTLAYSVDIPPNVASIDLRWPAAYQVHYSTSALSFPRTPEAIVEDTGADNYVFLTPRLAAGSYDYNVLQVSDEGKVQSSGILTTTDLTINAGPAAPTITSVTGDASALVVHWTDGEAGCTYTAYSSEVNSPINFGVSASPALVTTALNATSATLPAVSGYAGVDHSSDFDTLATAFTVAVADSNSAYDDGASGFVDAFQAAADDIADAIEAFAVSRSIDLAEYIDALNSQAAMVTTTAAAISDDGLTADDWTVRMFYPVGSFLAFCGAILSGDKGRFTFSNGALPGGNPEGTGASNDGSTGSSPAAWGQSLYVAGKPYFEAGKVRIVVRATKSGTQDQADREFTVELDDDGEIVAPRPNKANLEDIEVTAGLTVNVTASVIEDATSADATSVQLFVVAQGDPFDFGDPQDSEDLSGIVANYHKADLSYSVLSAGWYDLAVRAVTADGVLSADYEPVTIYLSNATPSAVSALTAKVIRAKGIELG